MILFINGFINENLNLPRYFLYLKLFNMANKRISVKFSVESSEESDVSSIYS